MADVVLIFGRRGTGKTYLLRELCREWDGPLYVHDPMAQLDDLDPDGDADETSLVPGAMLALDEIDLLAGVRGYREVWVQHAVHYGRHLGVSLIGTSRRPASVHRDLSALATEVYVGRITEPRDIKYCVDAWGEQFNNINTLPPWQFLHYFP